MSKNSKKRRDAKKKKIAKVKNKNTALTTRKLNKLSPHITKIENPFSHLSNSQRADVRDTMANKAKNEINKIFDELIAILKKYNPISLISQLSYYGITTTIDNTGKQNVNSRVSLLQAHLEIIQALILHIPEHELGQDIVPPEIIEICRDNLIDLHRNFMMSRLDFINENTDTTNQAMDDIQETTRKNTQIVRNWGFYSQVKTISTDVYSNFDTQLIAKLGFSVTHIIDAFDFIFKDITNSLNENYKNMAEIGSSNNKKEMLLKYYKFIGQDLKEVDVFLQRDDIKSIDEKQLFNIILYNNILELDNNYYININKLADYLKIKTDTLCTMLDEFSYNSGDLKDHKTEYFFLNNPIWNKPIIKTQDKYFYVIPQLFFSFIIPNIHTLLEKHIKPKKLSEGRANYLERKIGQIIKIKFPNLSIISGLKWSVDDNTYETDLIICIDSYAIIIEAKSHKISQSALRGGQNRLKRHIKEIIINPGVQSLRLQKRLIFLKENPEIKDDLKDKLPLNSIHKIIRISVTLEDFATILGDMNSYIKTDFIPENFESCPTMNLADFETLFDLFDHPVQIIDYLEKRTYLAKYGIMADELDFMGQYLVDLLNIENLTKNYHLIATGMSEPIDKFYISKESGVIIKKPKPKITALFRKIFEQLEKRATSRWIEIGVALNRFSPIYQIKIENEVHNLRKKVHNKWAKEGHKNTVIYIPEKSFEYALAYVLFKDGNKHKKRNYIQYAASEALKSKHVTRCVVIAQNIDIPNEAYNFIGIME